jgi:8-amino-7-oxononanoate synthase
VSARATPLRVALRDDARARLNALEEDGLLRRPPRLDSPVGRTVELGGRTLLCFSSNDYLGLAADPQLRDAFLHDVTTAALGSGASRLICGTQRPHLELEGALAEFLGRPAGALFSTGYAANVGLLQGLAERGDLIVSDALNHASLIDGSRLSRARIEVVPHLDLDAFERALRERTERRAFIVTEAIFSMDGDEAPLAALAELAQRYDASLIVDEAHSIGVRGPEGRGLCHALGITPELVIATFGKAFGAAGALVAGDDAVIELLRHRARSYVFSTAPSPLTIAGLGHALRAVRAADDRRTRLGENAARLRDGLISLGYRVPQGSSAIIPVLVGANEATLALDAALRERGFLVQAIRPPTVPTGTSRLRLVPTSSHEREDIDALLEAFDSLRPTLMEPAP